jgi:Flagellar hook-length control protein FliK
MINMISINTFEALDNQKKPAENSEEPNQFDNFSDLLAAFLFTPADVKPPLKCESLKESSSESNDLEFEAANSIPNSSFLSNSETSPTQFVSSIPFSVKPAILPEPPLSSSPKDINFETKPVAIEPAKQPLNETKPSIMPPPFHLAKKENSDAKLITDSGARDFNQNNSTTGDFEILTSDEENETVVWKPMELAPPNPITKTEFAASISQLFQGVSRDLKDEKAYKSDVKSVGDLVFKKSDIEETKATEITPITTVESLAFETATGNSGLIERKNSKLIANNNSAENLQIQSFDKQVSSFETISNPEESSKIAETSEKVFRQIEAHIAKETLVFTPNIDKPNILKLRLRPAELGTVEIKLEKDASGKLTAHFQTETEATKQILVERFEGLQNALQNAGWQIDKLDFSTKSFSTAGNENREDQSRQTETRENRNGQTERLEGVLEKKDESSTNRLVSLRA